MKKIQKNGLLIMISILLAGISSCDKDNNIAAFEVFGDVIIIKRMVGDQSKFARSYYAYGNYQMSSAEVTLPEGGTIVLASPDESKRVYLKEPAIVDYENEPPTTGNFDFTVVNEDIEHTVSDQLVFNNLAYANITRAEYTAGAAMVEWESVPDADNYVVQMHDTDNNIVFTGFLVSPANHIYQISANNGAWETTPVGGGTYIIEIHTLEYEDGATSANSEYNINEISISSQSIVWGN